MAKTKAIVKRNGSYELSNPDQMIQVAKRIKEYIVKNSLSVNIAGHDYVMVEGWQFAGNLMGISPIISEVKDLGNGKWMATAMIKDKAGILQGVGYALCSKAESKKASFDEYAILSMVQTRAIGKAFRNRIGWIIKLAGYESCPAEEMKKAETKKPIEPESGTDHIAKLKTEIYKMGAKDEKAAIKMVKDKTGLIWKDFKITQKQAQIALFMILNETKK
jgi:hypothetical protein